MVQIMVEVRTGRWQERRQFELLECTTETGILELKQRAAVAAAASAAANPDLPPPPPGPPAEEQELVFMNQTCANDKRLHDYGICHDWIAQVTGFVLRPKFR